MRPVILSHRQAIKNLYQQDMLSSIAKVCQEQPLSREGDYAFSSFQRDVLHRIFPGFTYQFCVTSTVTTAQNFNPESVKSVCLDLPDEVLESYMKVAQYDRMSQIVFMNPGRALSSIQIHPDKQRHLHPFFHRHAENFGIDRGISIGFNYPGHHTTFIAFDYLSDPHNDYWIHFDFTRLELATFPFALAWFARRGMIDMKELEKRFYLLADLTENQLGNLRKFINCPDESYEQQAQSLGVKQSTLKESLYKIRDQVTPRFAVENDIKSRQSGRALLRPLENQYSFLSLLGDGTKPLMGLDEERQRAKLDCIQCPPKLDDELLIQNGVE